MSSRGDEELFERLREVSRRNPKLKERIEKVIELRLALRDEEESERDHYRILKWLCLLFPDAVCQYTPASRFMYEHGGTPVRTEDTIFLPGPKKIDALLDAPPKQAIVELLRSGVPLGPEDTVLREQIAMEIPSTTPTLHQNRQRERKKIAEENLYIVAKAVFRVVYGLSAAEAGARAAGVVGRTAQSMAKAVQPNRRKK
jgi:hypothetical protein